VITTGDGSFELVHIHVNAFEVQAQSISLTDDCVFTQRLPQDVDRHLQQVSRAFLIAFGPERSHEPLAAHSRRPTAGEQAQQGQPVTLSYPSAQR
jgi:hypothetical protein